MQYFSTSIRLFVILYLPLKNNCRIINYVPRELTKMIGTDSCTQDEVREILKLFKDVRRKQFYDDIKTYYNFLPEISKNENRLALADIFLPGNFRNTARFEWQ